MDEYVARFDLEWKHGDKATAREMARVYVEANRATLEPILSQYSLEGLVGLIDDYRKAGREEDRIIADMWLLSEYQPQKVTGQMAIGSQQMAALVEAQVAAIVGKE
jgi:hypothetical protein